MIYPAYGKQLEEARKNGKRPAHPVIVSLDVWEKTEPNYRIVIKDDQPADKLELAYLRGLDVLLQIRNGIQRSRIVAVLIAILKQCPEFLAIYNADKREGYTVINNGRVACWKWGEWEINRWYGRQ